MRNKIIKSGLFAILIILSVGCKKSEILRYQDDPTVYFSEVETRYTFVEHQDQLVLGYDHVTIPVQLSGFPADYDRNFTVSIETTDTLNTATSSMITFEDGVIPAGESTGYVKAKLIYQQEMDDSLFVAMARINPSVDFPTIDLNYSLYSITFGNILTMPDNWSMLKFYFGNYSNSWYQFILLETGLSYLPYKYYTGSADSAVDSDYYYMSMHEIAAYAALVREALNEYNQENPDNPLTHEDGDYAGQVVTMGNF